MDNATGALASYATLGWADLSEDAIRAAKARIIDSIGCAAGGYASEPARIGRLLAAEASSRRPARLWFSQGLTSPDMAAFTNAVMVRYLDWNDTLTLATGGHPSDMIPVLVAVAECRACSGRELLVAIAAAYEAFAALAETVAIRERGWDQGLFIGLGAAVGLANLFKLSPAATAHALALTVTPNVPTRQTRAGELSMWKACATAAATRSALFACELAELGLTGPDQAFEGRHGVFDLVTGPLRIPQFAAGRQPLAVQRSHIKCFPSEFHSQAPIWLAFDLRKAMPAGEIEDVDIATYWLAFSEIGSEPEKWTPKTRETADHSLPFLVATALLEGDVTTASFASARFSDPELLRLMARIRVREEKSFTARYPGELASRMIVTTRSGKQLAVETRYPKGHAANPLTEAELIGKFQRSAEGVLSAARPTRIVELVGGMEALPTIDVLLNELVAEEPPASSGTEQRAGGQ